MIRFGDQVKEYLTAKIKKQEKHEELFVTLTEALPSFKQVVHSQTTESA